MWMMANSGPKDVISAMKWNQNNLVGPCAPGSIICWSRMRLLFLTLPELLGIQVPVQRIKCGGPTPQPTHKAASMAAFFPVLVPIY